MYQAYEFNRHLTKPIRLWANTLEQIYSSPYNPLTDTWFGKSVAASAEIVARLTQNYGKPEFGLKTTQVGNETVAVNEEILLRKPFCQLLRFHRDTARRDPKVLVVAPMSGHFATLLRGTVETLLLDHNVYLTDWVNARDVPLLYGRFDLDDFVELVVRFVRLLGPRTHVMAVCQPSVPVLAAVSLLATDNDPCQPSSMILMGGPIDTRANPTAVNRFAEAHSLDWFERTVITTVPARYPGAFRRVYPGFLQLAGFLSMNFDRHVSAHWTMFRDLARGNGESAAATRAFYNEYTAVMDLPADFYLQTIERVFHRHDLPLGEFRVRGRLVEPAAIEHTALMTVEGERDDVCGPGQTVAAHNLCTSIAPAKKTHHLQLKVGHYGVFHGRRWQTETYPKVKSFIRALG